VALAVHLADELAVQRLLAGDGLLVGHLGVAHVGLHGVLALEAIDDDVQVQLAHAGNERLTGVFVCMHTECGVFFLHLAQGGRELFFVGLGLGLDGNGNDAVGEAHGL